MNKYITTYKIFESQQGIHSIPMHDWDFYKNNRDIMDAANDVLLELSGLNTATRAYKYKDGNGIPFSAFHIDIKATHETRFEYQTIKPTIMELISQMDGRGFKFLRYKVEGYKDKGWNRAISNLNNSIERFPLISFEIEFIKK